MEAAKEPVANVDLPEGHFGGLPAYPSVRMDRMSGLRSLLAQHRPLPPARVIDLPAMECADAHEIQFNEAEIAAVVSSIKVPKAVHVTRPSQLWGTVEYRDSEALPQEEYVSKMPAVNPAHAAGDALFDEIIDLETYEEFVPETEATKPRFSVKRMFGKVKEVVTPKFERKGRIRGKLGYVALTALALIPASSTANSFQNAQPVNSLAPAPVENTVYDQTPQPTQLDKLGLLLSTPQPADLDRLGMLLTTPHPPLASTPMYDEAFYKDLGQMIETQKEHNFSNQQLEDVLRLAAAEKAQKS